mmetsp:Transcript_25735/g.72107  ORF Transcript_25735/g.72107 Transcript_25735/m.72107 type:complete len:238 (+) Transcript_25735:881-1594(+)
MATCRGTATWSMARYGSGEMTVRPLKSTRLPLRFPRNRPCLPLRRWTKPRRGLPWVWKACGSPGTSLLMYIAHCTCRKSQLSISWWMARPFCKPHCRMLFTSMIWLSLMVTSSSLLPLTISTEGRMHTGGTGMVVMMRFSGRLCRPKSSQFSRVICWNSPSTRRGCRLSQSLNLSFSTAWFRSGLCRNASPSMAFISSMCSACASGFSLSALERRSRSCTSLNAVAPLRTVPLNVSQ